LCRRSSNVPLTSAVRSPMHGEIPRSQSQPPERQDSNASWRKPAADRGQRRAGAASGHAAIVIGPWSTCH
jgi:hypothetical protein